MLDCLRHRKLLRWLGITDFDDWGVAGTRSTNVLFQCFSSCKPWPWEFSEKHSHDLSYRGKISLKIPTVLNWTNIYLSCFLTHALLMCFNSGFENLVRLCAWISNGARTSDRKRTKKAQKRQTKPRPRAKNHEQLFFRGNFWRFLWTGFCRISFHGEKISKELFD